MKTKSTYEAVYFHVEHRPRVNNPTYSSVFVNASLNNFVPSPYAKNLLKQTQYKKSFDKIDGTQASYQTMLKTINKTKQNIFNDTKMNQDTLNLIKNNKYKQFDYTKANKFS